MKKYVLLGLWFCQIAYAQDLPLLSPDFTFEKGGIYPLFGDQVKLRAGPNTDSEVRDLLDIGMGVKIIERNPRTQIYNGIESHWYKVAIQGEEGYILGGLIALDHVIMGEAVYLVSLGKEGDVLKGQVRVIREEGSRAYEEIAVNFPVESYLFQIEGKEIRGIDGVNNAILIDFVAEACGVNGGGSYIFDTGEKLIEAFRFIEASDAGVYSVTETLIFPDDQGGKEGTVIFKRVVWELKDEETNWEETVSTEREIQWIGNQFFPKIREQK